MPIPRSKSAPHPIASALDGKHKLSLITADRPGESSVVRSKSFVTSAPLVPVYPSSALERDDPFSLSTFFPSPLQRGKSVTGSGEWQWLRGGHDVDRDVLMGSDADDLLSSSSDGMRSVPPTPGGIMFGEDLTGESIKDEDKFGVLSINNPFAMRTGRNARTDDDRLFSPYASDDPVDNESLYDAMSRRRQAQYGPPELRLAGKGTGELFSSGLEKDEKAEDETWGSLLLTGLREVFGLS